MRESKVGEGKEPTVGGGQLSWWEKNVQQTEGGLDIVRVIGKKKKIGARNFERPSLASEKFLLLGM